ncbi:hypothetical protein [Sinomonas susongensis]|uniref:hypothetical protein n=1 Tax=Sinomonas susongensis TaxID=1324851 RepID=UPI0011095D0C|nr:hypothetical protein [Sinomonas susongensis]
MIDAATLRKGLAQGISNAERTKLDDSRPMVAGCAHPLQTYRQTVVPTNARFKGAGAHFIVKACVTCRTKRAVDYVVER